MPRTLYEAAWVFMIYAFLGWCLEVIYVGLNNGHFVNRGFLNGPYCPIYGFGVLIVITLLSPLQNNLLLLFIGSVLLTSTLEFLTGLVLEKIFSRKWWDYSDVPFNLMGYICLKFSIFWGLGCMFVVKIVHPYIMAVINWTPLMFGYWLLLTSGLWLILDFAATIDKAWDDKKNIRVLEKSAERMRRISDEIGEGVYKTASNVAVKVEDTKEFVRDKQKKVKSKIEKKK